MRRRLLAAVSVAVFLAVTGFAIPGSAGPRRQAYREARQEAVQQVGAEAPGRDIVQHGMRDGSAPTKRQLKESVVILKRMAHPATLVSVEKVSRRGPTTNDSVSQSGGGAGGKLASIRSCESGGDYSTDTGNGFYGAYQFTLSTWASVGGSGNPAQASPAEQDRRAATLLARDGAGQWPVCGQ